MDRLEQYESLIRMADCADRDAARLEAKYGGIRPGWVSADIEDLGSRSRNYRRKALILDQMQ